ncbi:MAG: arylmalonate decarboxylase [Ramlibacter sp.]|nr:arylmalonate decarboxylase [Ramlibacter sp.]
MPEQKTPTIGLIVPPGHGRVPTDAGLLYGDRINFIARGLGIAAISPDGFNPVVDAIVENALRLRDAGAQAISMMGTSISFYRGAAFTEDLRARMQEATGVPCTTMSHAIVASLRALGVHRVAVATSYIDELNDRLVDYLAAAGFEVSAIEGLSLTAVDEVAALGPETLLAHAAAVYRRDPSADGVFISCGALLTLDVIAPLEKMLGRPATASSPAGFWDVVQLAGLDAASPGFGILFEPQLLHS